MSSFHKTIDSCRNLLGTKLKNNLLCISSGIPSLDHIIGGGLPAGAIFAVGMFTTKATDPPLSRLCTEEDVLGNYSRVLNKYFLAEGVVCKHDILMASADEDSSEILNELPQPCLAPPDEGDNTCNANSVNKMKIAWRYEGLNQVESSFGTNSNFGHFFDLSKYIDSDTIKASNISCWRPKEPYTVKGFKNSMYHDLLTHIRALVSKKEYQSNSGKNILRINIQSIGSSFWLASDYDEDLNPTGYGKDLLKFMYSLRIILRDTTAVAFVTIPSHLFDDENLMKRLLYSIDNAVKIESFAGSSRETNPVYKDYHGLFNVTKLSAIYSLVPFVPPSLDMAFKLRRKKFIIEKLHLPPELQESSEREQDDIVSATPLSCGGFKKKDIDF